MFTRSLYNAVKRFGDTTWVFSESCLNQKWKEQPYHEDIRSAFFITYEELRDLAAKTCRMRNKYKLKITTAQRAVAQYHSAFRDLQAVLTGIDDNQLDLQPAKEEWPLRITLGHMILCDRTFFAVIKHAISQAEQGKMPIGITEDDAEELMGPYNEFEKRMDQASLAEILDYSGALHDRILTELGSLKEEELHIHTFWWEDKPVPVEFRLHRFESHFRQHTIQVEKTLANLHVETGEAKRLLRLIYAALADTESLAIGAWDIGADLWVELTEKIILRTQEIRSFELTKN
jgi:hypothetical protein